MYHIQHCFMCRPSDSTVSEDAGIKPGNVAILAVAVYRRSNHSARSEPCEELLTELLTNTHPWFIKKYRRKRNHGYFFKTKGCSFQYLLQYMFHLPSFYVCLWKASVGR
jgi:hypothetical protein